MGLERIIEILKTEKECVKRNHGRNCNRNCAECDLLLNSEDILTAYTLAISVLKTIHGDRKVMSPTGAQNEFTIL